MESMRPPCEFEHLSIVFYDVAADTIAGYLAGVHQQTLDIRPTLVGRPARPTAGRPLGSSLGPHRRLGAVKQQATSNKVGGSGQDRPELDRWALSELNDLVERVTEALETLHGFSVAPFQLRVPVQARHRG